MIIFMRSHTGELLDGRPLMVSDRKIESLLSTGDSTLSFNVSLDTKIENEDIVKDTYTEEEYVVKEVTPKSFSKKEVVCALNVQDLEAVSFEKFSISDQTIGDAAAQVLLRMEEPWTVEVEGSDFFRTKTRSITMQYLNGFEALKKLTDAYMCDVGFFPSEKKVVFYEERGEFRGSVFYTGLNLKELTVRTTSHDFYTRIIPYGKNGMTIESVNDGKTYLSNNQYSNKVIPYIWRDESYTSPAALKEDAARKLEDLARPVKSYSATLYNLYEMLGENNGYSQMAYSLGDTVLLLDPDTDTSDRVRITKTVTYPDDHEKDSVELSTNIPTFEDLQAKVKAMNELLTNTIGTDGTISVSSILNFNEGVQGSTSIIEILNSIQNIKNGLTLVGSAKQLHIDTAANSMKYVELRKSGNPGTEAVSFVRQTDTGATNFFQVFDTYGNFKLTLSSDIRLKENVEDTRVKALPILKAIRMRQFDWKDTGKHQDLGFIADELEEIDSSLAFGGGYVEDGCLNVKSVDTSYLMGYIVKGMQELITENTRLKSRMTNLEKKVDGLCSTS